MILIIILYALMASSFTIAKAVLTYASPIFFIGFRMVIAGLVLLGYCTLFRPAVMVLHKKDWLHFALIILLHIYAAFVLDLVAMQDMTSFKAAFLYNLSPFLSALLAYFYFTEKMTIKKGIGLLVGFSGFLPELITQVPQEASFMGLLWLSRAEVLMLCSVVASVMGWTVMRVLIKKGYSPLWLNGFSMLSGGLLALGTSLVVEQWHPVPVESWLPFLYLTALIIVVANIIGYNLYGHLLKIYTTTFISFAGFLTPLFAALFGWLFLGEVVSYRFFFSLFVVIIGLTLFYYEELRQGYIKHA